MLTEKSRMLNNFEPKNRLGKIVPPHIMWPTNLPKSKPPLTIVCGAPGAGKSTYVRERKGPSDIVIDLGEIVMELAGISGARHPGTDKYLLRGAQVRNRRLIDLATSDAPAAWFIIGAPKLDQRHAWAKMLGARQVVVVLTPLAETLKRTDADPYRTWVRKRLRDAAVKWWADYRPHPDDVTTGAHDA